MLTRSPVVAGVFAIVLALAGCGKSGAPPLTGTPGPDPFAPSPDSGMPAPGPTPGDASTPPSLPDAGSTTPADAGVVIYLRDWVVSPTGSDSSAGDSAHPFRTIPRALAAVSPGERILVQPGTYTQRVNITGTVRAGTSALPIRLQGVNMPRIVPDGVNGGSLVAIEKPNWQVDGFELDVQGQKFYAAHFVGTVTGSVLSHSNVHGGTSGAGISTHYAAVGATIEDNEIHDFQIPGDDSHGVLVQPGSKNITIRRNVIHDNTGDSIQCIGPEDLSSEPPADGVQILDNTMFHDREQSVDIKTCSNVRVAGNTMRDYLEALPGGCSMVVHMSASNITIEDNDIFNVGKAIAIGGNHYGPVPYNVVVRRNKIRNVVKGTDLEGIAIKLENSESAKVLNNTIWGVDYAAIMAGGGDGGPTSNLSIKDNIVVADPGAFSIYLGTEAPGLVTRSNLFGPGALFSAVNSSGSRQSYSFSGWQATGRDSTSRQADPQLQSDTLAPGAAAIDWGENVGLPYCGAGPDIGAVETGCP